MQGNPATLPLLPTFTSNSRQQILVEMPELAAYIQFEYNLEIVPNIILFSYLNYCWSSLCFLNSRKFKTAKWRVLLATQLCARRQGWT